MNTAGLQSKEEIPIQRGSNRITDNEETTFPQHLSLLCEETIEMLLPVKHRRCIAGYIRHDTVYNYRVRATVWEFCISRTLLGLHKI